MRNFFLIPVIILCVSFFLYPNFSHALTFPNDPYYKNQWYLNYINLPAAWDYTKGSDDVVIAIIDSGVDIDHPDLKDNIWVNEDEIAGDGIDNDNNGYIDDVNGWDFINDNFDPKPKCESGYNEVGVQHGTVVAGVLAARGNNKEGITGVSWYSKIMPLRAMDSSGNGDNFNVIKAINYAIENGADIINMSFVGFNYSEDMNEALKRAYEKGILIVAAGGNYNSNGKNGEDLDSNELYPICYDMVNVNLLLGVAATNELDQKAKFSNYGSKCVDISAPGTNFISTQFYDIESGFDKYYTGDWSGTSLAAPLISGTAALIKSFKPDYSPEQIANVILENSQSIDKINSLYTGKLGRGRLNTEKIFLALSKSDSQPTSVSVKPPVIDWGSSSELLIAGDNGFNSQVRFFQNNNLIREWLAYKDFTGGLNIAAGDLDGNGSREIITAVASVGGPQIKIFNVNGKLLGQFMAYDKSLRGGVNVAVGDINGDGKDEIITGMGSESAPEIKIFNGQGEVLEQFLSYAESFHGGVNVAVGDINGNGKDEIITGPASAGGPQVRIFNEQGKVLNQFMAYDKSLRGGVNVAVGDINGDGKDEITTGSGSGSAPEIKIFNGQGEILGRFLSYAETFHGGVNVAVGDINSNGKDEIITGPASAGGPQVRIFNQTGQALWQFFAMDKKLRGGINLAVLE